MITTKPWDLDIEEIRRKCQKGTTFDRLYGTAKEDRKKKGDKRDESKSKGK